MVKSYITITVTIPHGDSDVIKKFCEANGIGLEDFGLAHHEGTDGEIWIPLINTKEQAASDKLGPFSVNPEGWIRDEEGEFFQDIMPALLDIRQAEETFLKKHGHRPEFVVASEDVESKLKNGELELKDTKFVRMDDA